MSLWYDQNKKEYASDGKYGWLKAYCLKLCSDISENLKSHFSGTVNRHSADSIDYSDSFTVKAKIDTESSERKSRDDVLQTNINTETAARKSADETLQSNISSEASERKSADEALQTSINNEASERKSADETLQSNISSEASERKSADGALQANIDAEVADRKAAIAAINDLSPKSAANENIDLIIEGEYRGDFVAESGSNSKIDEVIGGGSLPEIDGEEYSCGYLTAKSTKKCYCQNADGGYYVEQIFIPHGGNLQNSNVPPLIKRHGYIEDVFCTNDEEHWDEYHLTWSAWFVDDFVHQDTMLSELNESINDLQTRVNTQDGLISAIEENAFSGEYSDLAGTPELAPVATSGDYTDLTNKPKILKPATVVIGTSARGYTSSDVDYLCGTSSAQTQINNAISALPSTGGRIVLLEGIYNCSGQINVNKSNVVIEGMGMGNTTLSFSNSGNGVYITASKCAVKNLSVTETTGSGYGIRIYTTSCKNVLVSNVEIYNCALALAVDNSTFFKCDSMYLHDNTTGLHINGSYGLISNCKCIDNSENGINIEGSYNKICNNYVIRGTGQTSDYSSSQYTLITKYNASYNDFSDNYILGKNYTNSASSTNTFVNNRYE